MALENIGYVEAALGGAAVVYFLMVVHHWWRDRNAVIMAWPVVGMLPQLLLNASLIHDYANEILKKSGGTFVFKNPWFTGDSDFIITSSPSNIEHILTSNFANYPKGEEFREVFDPLGDGILNVDSDLWRLQRKMFQLWSRRHKKFVSFIAKTIHHKLVDHFIPFLDNHSQTGLQVDLQESFQRMITFDNAILLTMGVNPTSHWFQLPQVEYQKAFEDMQKAVIQRHILPQSFWKLQRWLKIGGEAKLAKARKIFDEFMFRCISLKQEQLAMNSINNTKEEDDDEAHFGMLSIYLEEKEKPYSTKFLKDVAMDFMAASRDTFSSSLTWFFWVVATHPTVETKIIEEMKQYLDPRSTSFGVEELNKLIYLQAAVYETFRLYPPLPFNHKTADKDDILPSGHRVKKKQRVLMSFYSTGRMEEIWGKDCLEFKPERWITEEGGFVYVPSHKYPIFNGGPRTCLGKDMTLIQMKVAAITILAKYSFQVVVGHPISPSLTVTMGMKSGLVVKVLKRCSS
ncbi:alkane hydroxylase MAH1-like [Humulus lupulus]|uniref:alkane hydroxylase MAH1-like n=1 Tax=Humulus lupulus TaxID=3486 RepID=UPI002B4107C5|nr:alkane hydroxylase MAH1-like [Humulus lupulus]